MKLFNRSKTIDDRATPPPPLQGRNGHVGGIEAIILNGVTLFFGSDFSSDLVLSPLIDDADLMARFTSVHMRQCDGPHHAAYWLELVDSAHKEERPRVGTQLIKARARDRQESDLRAMLGGKLDRKWFNGVRCLAGEQRDLLRF